MALTPTINLRSTNEAFFVLLTITDVNGVARFVNNNEDVVSRGETYMAYAFGITLPSQSSEEAPSVRLTIDNVDRQITQFIRSMLEPPTVKIELVLSSALDVVERSIDFMRLTNVTYDALSVSGTLVLNDPLSMPVTDSEYNGTEFPDLVYT